MPKKCKTCEYKNKYDNLKDKYEKQEDIIKALNAQKYEIIKEIKKSITDTNGKPQKDVIEYVKDINKELQTNNTQYKTMLRIIYYFFDAILAIFAIMVVYYIFETRDFNGFVIFLPLFCFSLVMYLNHKSLKEKTESDSFNLLAILISVASLILSFISLIK